MRAQRRTTRCSRQRRSLNDCLRNCVHTEAVIVMSDEELPPEIPEWLTQASNAQTPIEHRYCMHSICELLKARPHLVKAFSKMYLVDEVDECELGNALAVLGRVDREEPAVGPVLIRFIETSRATSHYKRDAVSLLSRLADSMPVAVFRRFMNQPDNKIRRCLANDLLLNINRVTNESKALRLIKLSLRLSSTRDEDLRESILDSVITFGTHGLENRARNYEFALNRLKRPHHKTLMFVGLTVAAPVRADAYAAGIQALGRASKLANWYLNKFAEMR
jgi:hypothetical protein